MGPAPGQRICRNVVLVRLIGAGGMATVWVADDLDRECRVAVKFLRPEFTRNAEIVDRFSSEARAMPHIRSSFVPKVYERGALADGTPFIVMELLEGVDLDAYLRAHGALSLRDTARIVSQIAAALEAAHRIGVVHRDVKVENIFIQGYGESIEAKLFDFGIAKVPFEAHRTHAGDLMGTPGYMSPEQLTSSKGVDDRADYWSLSVVAYVALTGKLPFNGETFGAVCIAVHQGVYALPSRVVPGLPVELDAWFAKAFNPDPEKRFQTASELSASLMALAHADRSVAITSRRLLLVPEYDGTAARGPVAGGLSHTPRPLREPRSGLFLVLAAVFAAFVVDSMSPGRAGAWLQHPATSSTIRTLRSTESSLAKTKASTSAQASEAPSPRREMAGPRKASRSVKRPAEPLQVPPLEDALDAGPASTWSPSNLPVGFGDTRD
jgi:eukaryotic-like serine/threonine-protein kinase